MLLFVDRDPSAVVNALVERMGATNRPLNSREKRVFDHVLELLSGDDQDIEHFDITKSQRVSITTSILSVMMTRNQDPSQ